jgi:hypothetical protein
MSRSGIRENLVKLFERLPDDKAELLLEFATFLSRQARLPESTGLTPAERELERAEDYWFGLPESTRRLYSGQTVAVTSERIVDADPGLSVLRHRVAEQHPGQVVLFIDAAAEREPELVLRSPRLE